MVETETNDRSRSFSDPSIVILDDGVDQAAAQQYSASPSQPSRFRTLSTVIQDATSSRSASAQGANSGPVDPPKQSQSSFFGGLFGGPAAAASAASDPVPSAATAVAAASSSKPVARELPLEFWSAFRKAFDHRGEGQKSKRPVQSALVEEEVEMLNR
jgi:hypothetical protein